jgi:type II secretory pathway pseudopilin PulG
MGLVEVLVSALMVILIASATAGALIAGSHFSGDQRFRSQANALAQQDQDRLRGLSDQQLSGFSQARTVTFPNGTSFKVQSSATFEDASGNAGCTSNAAAYYKLVSTVSWTENFSSRPASITEESIVARPVGGGLIASATDQTLQPLQGVAVSASGPSTAAGSTDANGCVVLAGLTAGTYTATATKAGSGQSYVDPNGHTSATMAANVPSTGAVNAGTVHLGLPGTATASLTTATTGVSGQADAISWLGAGAAFGMSSYQSATPASSPATSIPTGSLFPFDLASTLPASYTNNYTLWGGKCLQNEPPTAGVTQGTVTPGSSQTVNVQEPELDVQTVKYQVTGSHGTTTTAVKPNDLKLTFSSTAGTSCTDSWYPAVTSATAEPSTGWLAVPGQPFASTTATGATASAASTSGSPQEGAYTICADYNASGTYYNGTTTNVTNTNFTTTPTPLTITITNSGSSSGNQGKC